MTPSATCRAAVCLVAALCAAAASGSPPACGERPVKGRFVQRKVLKDVDVTLTSEGEWSFEKGRSFVWRTLRPMPSIFEATPTNYAFTVGGRTSRRELRMRIDSVSQIFTVKEMRDFVEKVDASAAPPLASSGGIDIPRSLTVRFRNGDRLEVELSLCDP